MAITSNEWESTTNQGDGADKYRWNSHWFAQHGYYVLTYTARGFRDDGTTGAYQPPTPSGAPNGSVDAPNGTLHVKSRDYEVRDTQWLAALVAAAYPGVDPSRVAVTGGSYGGGETWMQASQARWDFPHMQDRTLPVLDLQVAVPKYPWTDLAYSLAPNGHGGGPSRQDIYESSQAVQSSDTGGGTPATGNPLGVPKASYIAGLFASGNKQGTFDEGTDVPPPVNENGPENIPAWNARITGIGDPYLDGDPVLQQSARGLTELRSAYYQDELWPLQVRRREVAIFSISGWTDDLFEPIESFRMFKYLKRLDPLWPVSVAAADVGHSRAQNKPEIWQRLNNQAFQFLQSNINGSHRRQTTVSSEPTTCQSDANQGNSPAQAVTASTPEGLANGTLSIAYSGGDHTLANPLSGGPDPNGPATDPIVGDNVEPHQDCRTDRGPALGGYTGYSQPLPDHTTYVGLGEVDVHYTLTPPMTQAQLDARVWDVPPSGPAFLITKGTYRFDTLNGYDSPTGDMLKGAKTLFAHGIRVLAPFRVADCSKVLTRGLSHTSHVRSPARARITLCVAEHHVVNPARDQRQPELRGNSGDVGASGNLLRVDEDCLREAGRSSAGRNRPRALMSAHTSARNRSSVGGELALRPERSAQAQMPPTARPVPRGERRGLLLLTAGLVPYYYGVTPPARWLRPDLTERSGVPVNCESCSAFAAAPIWTRAICRRDQP